jgi:hypothetical protein
MSEGKRTNKKGLVMENFGNILLWVFFILIAGFGIYFAVKYLFLKSAA